MSLGISGSWLPRSIGELTAADPPRPRDPARPDPELVVVHGRTEVLTTPATTLTMGLPDAAEGSPRFPTCWVRGGGLVPSIENRTFGGCLARGLSTPWTWGSITPLLPATTLPNSPTVGNLGPTSPRSRHAACDKNNSEMLRAMSTICPVRTPLAPVMRTNIAPNTWKASVVCRRDVQLWLDELLDADFQLGKEVHNSDTHLGPRIDQASSFHKTHAGGNGDPVVPIGLLTYLHSEIDSCMVQDCPWSPTAPGLPNQVREKLTRPSNIRHKAVLTMG